MNISSFLILISLLIPGVARAQAGCCKALAKPAPTVNCSLPSYNIPVSLSAKNACEKAGVGRSCFWDVSIPECTVSQGGFRPKRLGGSAGSTGGSFSTVEGANNSTSGGGVGTSGGAASSNGGAGRCCLGTNPDCAALDNMPHRTVREKHTKCMGVGIHGSAQDRCTWNPACSR